MLEPTAETVETLKKLDKLADKAPELKTALIREFGADAEKQVVKKIEEVDAIDSGAMVSTVRREERKDEVSVLVGGIKPKFTRGTSKKTGKAIDPKRANKVVDYAVYVNDGTSKIRGRFFMERGIFAAFSNLAGVGRRVLDNWRRSV